ncbi:MAG: nicotinamide-nucleotide amidohydrolase family protein [Actinobacteria bacterium]|uniref:Unannotated protein n=1 Tax=freshwater metagenome TaxID=449393 RepID=A0A6J7ETG8_9ZZZZ|nr:nicotinamide-nucleotide amidohydrolase family protein [Actinomycetota bacterium]
MTTAGPVLATDIVGLLQARELTLATAESITAGLVAATIADVPGCSSVLRGGVVAYATDTKASVLGVDPALLEHVVSQEVAVQLARAAARLLHADIGVGTTGVAGPDELDGQSPGTVWIAVHDAGRDRTTSRLLELSGDRRSVRQATVDAVFELVREVVEARPRALGGGQE